MSDPFRIKPGKSVSLSDFDPADTGKLRDRSIAEPRMARDLQSLFDLQELLYAARTHAVLIVLQGIDTAGKDGTIRHVFAGVNPQGCDVVCFKQPTDEEQLHDYLWRIHRAVPARGQIVIFNRSHYESVLVERVHELVERRVWERRYEEINQFERLLSRSGTIILKFFLNLSKAEQRRRLEARLKDPDKRWKANPNDWKDRKLWQSYRRAFEDMLSKTSTPHAPWFVVPSDIKWNRNLIVANRIVMALSRHRKSWRHAIRKRGKSALLAK
jgi:PPK2 family polyphosphate:nucleotide phosphotransferase